MSFVVVEPGEAPLILSIPHGGTDIPGPIAERLVSGALALKDTDWRMAELYGFARGLDATLVRTLMSRTVVDVNRDPSGVSLYPGQATTGLVPVETFDGEPLYRSGLEPDAIEVAIRRQTWFDPYHAALAAEIARLLTRHARIVLYDCHSIRSRVPRLFAGELPVFNIGTNDGRSAGPALIARIEAICTSSGQPTVLNGRFKGGWITRNYGRPDTGVDAIQMELAQRFYMDEDDPARMAPDKQHAAAEILYRIIEALGEAVASAPASGPRQAGTG